MAINYKKTILIFTILTVIIVFCDGKKQKYSEKQLALQKKETNSVSFISLLLMRLIYGLASSMGLGERLADFMGGVFVPPGADEDYEVDDFDY